MRLVFIFFRAYPLQSVISLGALILAGLIEGFGLTLLLPLLNIVVTGSGTAPAMEASKAASALEKIVNEIFGALGITPTVGLLLGIFVVSMLLKALLELAANKRVGYTIARVVTDLRYKFLQTMFASRWEFFIRQPVGKLANSMVIETNRASNAYLAGIKMMAALVQTFVFGVILCLISWIATLTAFAVGILTLTLFRRFIEQSRQAGKLQTKLMQSLMAIMTESLMIIKPLKTMAREHLANAVLENKAKHLKKAIKKQVFASTALSAFQKPITIIFISLGLYGALVLWKLPLASLLVMVYMFQKLMKHLQKVQRTYQAVAVAESAYWSLQKRVEEANDYKEPALGTRKVSLSRSIRLDRVSYAYDHDWILKNSDIEFPVGSFTAIVGVSGVGKTTVVDLVTGLLRPQKGEILIDDVPMAEIDLQHWRRMIGYVPQDTLLLHDSVTANVTLGDKEIMDKDVEHALRAAGAWDFVQTLPNGMETVVAERGQKLSGGQRQRIAIARALVHYPRLLILDEATTALDPENEAAICKTLGNLRGEITILAISHQSAVLNVADRAYRLEGGNAIQITDLTTEKARQEKTAQQHFLKHPAL